jgi:hypothetical protein
MLIAIRRALSPLPLRPIRPDVGTDHPAFRADHAWTELAHQEITGVRVNIDDHLVPATEAHHQERPDAVLAHVRQVHRLD